MRPSKASFAAASILPFLDQLAEPLVDALQPAIDELLLDVLNRHVDTDAGCYLCDAGTHLSGADDQKLLNRHFPTLCVCAQRAMHHGCLRIGGDGGAATDAQRRQAVFDFATSHLVDQ